MDHPFHQLPGVADVVSGFSGGTLPNPIYADVTTHRTGYYEWSAVGAATPVTDWAVGTGGSTTHWARATGAASRAGQRGGRRRERASERAEP